MIELAFSLLFAILAVALVYNVVMAVYYCIRAIFEFVTRPFRPRSFRHAPSTPSNRPHRPEPESKYTRDWASVSRKYKESRGWKCEGCGVYCGASKANRRLLHVHHRDLNPQNNGSWNLDALCVICHAERPGAGHRRLKGAISSDGRRAAVERLRSQQGR